MAKDKDKPEAAEPEARATITVRALQNGTTADVGNGRHAYRQRGEVFELFKDQHAPAWQEIVTDPTKPLPKLPEPLQTSLPAHMQPRSNG